MPIINITSNSIIDEIDCNFRISAGPGAGKTHWLINHISNVLSNSTRLGKARKIACITYTNVAVDTINKRLGHSTQNTEISTLHSFLYRNIIKPYARFLPNHFNFNYSKLDGHDDHRTYTKNINNWLDNHSSKTKFSHPYSLKQLKTLTDNQEALKNWILSIHWNFNDNNELLLQCKNSDAYYITESNDRGHLSKKALAVLSEDLLEYKKIFWRSGTLHHDDVLYFSYVLINEYPFILDVLVSKFPYIFIDEYQDTNPIQSYIINKLKDSEAIVGVIGDKAQSIYGFQGAKPDFFDTFLSDNMKKYTISQNRRSTKYIIDILNHIRKDMIQESYRNINGEKPKLLIGCTHATYQYAKKNVQNEKIQIISKNNDSVYNLFRVINGGFLEVNPIKKIIEVDSNSIRKNKILNYMRALHFAVNSKFKDAIHEIKNNNYIDLDADKKTRAALIDLFKLTSNYDKLKNGTVYEFYHFLKENIDDSLSKLSSKGKPKELYNETLFKDLFNQLNVMNEVSYIKTIHKTKGDDFINVLVYFPSEDELKFILEPNLKNNEIHRIYYVALSRAKDNLFISVPTLKSESEEELSSLFDIVRV